MRLLSAAGLPTTWLWLVGVIVGAVLAGALAIYSPQLLVLCLIAALALLLIDWLRTRIAITTLAEQIAAGSLSGKLEVRTGVWGALCHAVNETLQQQRVQQRVRTLLPAPPQRVLDQLLQGTHDAREMSAMATVLLISFTGNGNASLPLWQHMGEVARAQSEHQGALIQGFSGMMLLVFGVFKQQGRVTGLRAALETVETLRAAWDATAGSEEGTLVLTVANGPIVAGVVPGLGYSVLGKPVEQAMSLQQLAASQPGFACLCAEDTYVALRSLQHDFRRATGTDMNSGETAETWTQTDLRLQQTDRSPQAVYGHHA